MQRRQALFAAAIVLAAGLGGALLFRQSTPAEDDATQTADSVRHRAADGPLVLMEVRTVPSAAGPAPLVPALPNAKIETAARIDGLPQFEDGSASMPRIAQRYPATAGNPPAPPTAETRHRVSDGDTLASLAKRYLGDASRASAIYEANRDVLSDPELLPIGAVLKIPRG